LKEPLTFEVVDFPDVYHVLLGRPCFSKFMVVPNYTYLKLKMSGPNRVITIEGSLEQAYYCEQDSVAQAAALSAPCGPTSSSIDARMAPAKGGALVMAVLDRLGSSEAPDAIGGGEGSAGPSIKVLGPLEGAVNGISSIVHRGVYPRW
jgi:hypothetical protein